MEKVSPYPTIVALVAHLIAEGADLALVTFLNCRRQYCRTQQDDSGATTVQWSVWRESNCDLLTDLSQDVPAAG